MICMKHRTTFQNEDDPDRLKEFHQPQSARSLSGLSMWRAGAQKQTQPVIYSTWEPGLQGLLH